MSSEIGQETSQWYVVHTNPKQEERADSNLRAWGVETLHPKLKTRRFNEFTGAPTVTTRPLFPRYIFAKFNAREQLAKISFTRGVHYVVSFGDNDPPGRGTEFVGTRQPPPVRSLPVPEKICNL